MASGRRSTASGSASARSGTIYPDGGAGAPTSRIGRGAPCARTTLTTATPGRYLTYDKARAQGVPLGRGRHRRALRPLPAPVLRAGVLERARSAPEGAAVRGQPVRGQSRRGREGILLPRRQHADPLVHVSALQVSAGGVSVPRADRGEPAPRRTGSGVRAARYRGVRRRSLLRHLHRVRQGRSGGHRDPDHRAQPRARRRAAAHPADLVVPQHVGLGADAAARADDHVRAARTACAW